MSANMEDTMDVDEENMQVDEDPSTGELPMSTDEDSAQGTGVATKVVDVAMVSDSPDVDISEGPRAGSDGPTEMESDILTDEVGNPSSVKVGDKGGKDSGKESQDRIEPVFETSTDTLRDDITSLCQTQTEESGDNSNISGTSEEGVGELKNNPETASSIDADIHTTEKNNPGDDSNLSAENEVEPELEVENAVSNDETSQNNDGGNEDPLDSRAGLDTGENSNMTSVSASEENARDPFALDGDANSNAAAEQPTNAPNEDRPDGKSDLIISANINPVREGKSLAEELNEQLEKIREPRSADATHGNGKEKPADDDHISIDDASSTGVADAESADHVSVDGSSEGDRVLDHVSVDSDSDIENTTEHKAESLKKISDDRNVDSPLHTTCVNDGLEETPGVSGDSEKPADKSTDSSQLVIDVAADATDSSFPDGDKAATDKASNEENDQASNTNTVDLVESDDDSVLPTSSFSIRPRSSESLKSHITLIGKVVDTETIISDDTTRNRTGAVLRKELPPARVTKNFSTAEPSTPTSMKSDSSRLASKAIYSVKKLNCPLKWKCLQCAAHLGCPWKLAIGAGIFYICSDKCLEAHRVQRRQIIESGGPPATHIIQIADLANLKKKCALCAAIIPKNKIGSLTWEVMNFCDDDCLSKYQSAYTSNCCNCNAVVTTSSMGKYCVRFGHEVKQFCTPPCLDTYKKGIKTCSYCQKNLQDSSEGFLAPVGGKDQFRDFCSPDCLEKYDCICNNSTTAYSVDNCIVCDNVKVTQFELLSSSKVAKLCSDVCLAAYKFVNNIEVGICGMCNKYYDTMGVDETVTFNNDVPSTFCSKHCMNIHVISKRKIVPCAWCKAKKYNFDMVYRRGAADEDALFVCSVNCLVLHNVSLKSVPPKKVNCSYCKKLDVSTYHITMSDASVRHFCSYDCVLTFQSAFNVPALNANIPVPEGAAKKIVRSVDATVNSTSPGTQTVPLAGPTIQSVGTLKSIEPNNPPGLVPQNSAANKMKHTTLKIPSTFCFKPPEMKNKWTQIKVCGRPKGVSCKPKHATIDVQCDLGVGPLNGEKTPTTDSAKESSNESSSQKTAVIPIPVPIYVPHPMPMYTLPTPIPIPIPVPIIIPIIIPTSLENMDRVIDTLKEILEKSTRENPLSSCSTAGLSNACNEILQMRNEMDTGGERKKRMLEDDESVADLVPPKRARVVEEDMSSPETSESPLKMKLKFMLGPNTWKHFAKNRNESSENNDDLLKLDLLSMRSHELSGALAIFVREAKKANGDEYRPDLKFYLCLGIQYYLFENGRVDDIFGDTTYEELTDALDLEARKFNSSIDSPISRVEEEHLWESMQLGAKSPHVLLMTLMYFITLRFNLWTLEEHMQLSFNTFSQEIKSSTSGKPTGSKVIKLVINSLTDGADLKKQREFEFTENKKDLMRCPVRLYDFYITKCPENIKTHSDRFYLMPESSCTPESTVWYRSLALPPHMLQKMLNRVKMIKEIRESMHGHHGPPGDN